MGSDVVWRETLLGHVQSRCESLCSEIYVFALMYDGVSVELEMIH